MRFPPSFLIIVAGFILGQTLVVPAWATVTTREIARPCLSFNVLGGMLFQHPVTGNETMALTNMNETGGELLLVDIDTGEGKRIDAPGGQGGWAIRKLDDDRIAYGTFYDGKFMVYDLRKEAWVANVQVPGETYLWNFAIGKDGRLYAGTYGNGKLVSLDLTNYTVEDHGIGAPPNLYGRYVSALPDGRIFAHYNVAEPRSLVYDPATKQHTAAPAHLTSSTLGVSWHGYFLTDLTASDGISLERLATRPFTMPTETTAPVAVQMAVSTSETLYLQQDGYLFRVDAPHTTATQVSTVSLQNTKLVGVAKDGRVAGVRGQQYYVYKPGDKEQRFMPIPVESKPRPPLFLRLDPKGRIWGGPHFGQTIFVHDVKSGETSNTQVVTMRGGEVYDVAFVNNIGYMVSYVGGQVIKYDYDLPWSTAKKNPNPKILTTLGEQGFIRPAAGCVAHKDLIFSAMWADYGKRGGAISITSAKTEKTQLIKDLMGEHNPGGIAVDDQHIYVTTVMNANGLPPLESSPKFIMVERKSEKAIFEHQFTDLKEEYTTQTQPLLVDTSTGLVAGAVNGIPIVFDPKERVFLHADDLTSAPRSTSFQVHGNQKGIMYYGSGNDLIALQIADGAWSTVASFSDAVWSVTGDSEKLVYISSGTAVHEVHLD